MEIKCSFDARYRCDIFGNSKGRDEDMIWFSLFDFVRKYVGQEWIEKHQITIVKESWDKRYLVFATSQKDSVCPFWQCSNDTECVVSSVDFRILWIYGKQGSFLYIFLLVNQIFEYGECSSWCGSTLYESNFHQKRISPNKVYSSCEMAWVCHYD